jgi:hypothetical protein
MKAEAQRIKIAEACGWEDIHEEKHPAITYLWGYLRFDGQLGEDREMVPDYLNDLNAMHEAAEVLTERQRSVYGNLLFIKHAPEIADDDGPYLKSDSGFRMAQITAAQRCEAFLRTLKLWKEQT